MNMLRSIRERKGLTVGQLAARAGVPTRMLTEYEEGRQPIPLPHAKLLAKALWVRIEDLLPAANSVTQAPAPSSGQPAPPSYAPVQVQQPPRPQTPGTPPPSPPQPRPPGPPAYAGAAQGQRPQQGMGGQGVPMPRPANGTPRPGGQPPRREGQAPSARPPRPAPAPPKPISEGQVEELLRLAARLEMEQARVEQEMGKPVQSLTRTEAKDWIKKFREMTDESSPGSRVRYGQWPGLREDQEAAYLDKQRQAVSPFAFKMFNGEEFRGVISDFTPYTITIKAGSGEDVVLRKLAIAYYRQLSDGEPLVQPPVQDVKPKKAAKTSKSRATAATKAQTDEHHQPTSDDVDSDRIGEPSAPEADSMDEDRGV